MKNTSFFRGLAAGAVVVTGIMIAVPSYAAFSGGRGERRGPLVDNEQHEAVKTALENCDYDAWVSAHENMERTPRMLDVIDESNFDQFCEMHELMMSGDREAAQAIAEELGLPTGFGPRGGKMHGNCFDGTGAMLGAGKGMGMRGDRPERGFGRGVELSVEDREAFHEAMQACKTDDVTWSEIQHCRIDVMEQFRPETE